jgi:hypothetical protein
VATNRTSHRANAKTKMMMMTGGGDDDIIVIIINNEINFVKAFSKYV